MSARGTHLVELMPLIPPERLLPRPMARIFCRGTCSPSPLRGATNRRILRHIAAAVARARGESCATLARSSTRAARALFGLPGVDAMSN